MRISWECKLPRVVSKSAVTFDLETVKVARAGGPWVWPDGSKNARRWVPFVCGIGTLTSDRCEVEVWNFFSEREMIDAIEESLPIFAMNTGGRITYRSRNKFDEMVLKGRFVHARHALAAGPGDWPHWEEDECDLKFVPIGDRPATKFLRPASDQFDWPRLIRADWAGSNVQLSPALEERLPEVLQHCARDVLENLEADCAELELSALPALRRFYAAPPVTGG